MSKDSRQEILGRIKSGLSHGVEEGNSESVSRSVFRDKPIPDKDILAAMFVEEVTKVSGNACIVESESAVGEFIAQLVEKNSFSSFAIWDSPLLKKLEEQLIKKGLRCVSASDKGAMAAADFGITEADYAMADTGTLVLMADASKPRTVSLVPPIHIAILQSSTLLPNIGELFGVLVDKLKTTDDITSCMTFITGPSRTADIELNLTLGVHGPKELYVLVVK